MRREGEILERDTGHRGPNADLRIYEDRGVDRRSPNAKKIADPADRSAEHPTLPPPTRSPKAERGRRSNGKRIDPGRNPGSRGNPAFVGSRGRLLRDEYRLAVGLFASVAHAVGGPGATGRIWG